MTPPVLIGQENSSVLLRSFFTVLRYQYSVLFNRAQQECVLPVHDPWALTEQRPKLHPPFIPLDLGLVDILRHWRFRDEAGNRIRSAALQQLNFHLEIGSLGGRNLLSLQPFSNHVFS